MKQVDTHIHLGIDDDGEPVAAFQTVKEAREAVESDSIQFEEIVDYAPDVPLFEEGSQ